VRAPSFVLFSTFHEVSWVWDRAPIGGAFFSSINGPLPFAIAKIPPEEYLVYLFLNEQMGIDEAIPHFRATLKLEPDDANSHNHLGVALIGKGEVEEAIVHYREAIRLNPDFAEAHNNLGTSLGQLMKLEEAIAHYREAIRLKPDYAPAHKNLAIVLSLMNKDDVAPELF